MTYSFQKVSSRGVRDAEGLPKTVLRPNESDTLFRLWFWEVRKYSKSCTLQAKGSAILGHTWGFLTLGRRVWAEERHRPQHSFIITLAPLAFVTHELLLRGDPRFQGDTLLNNSFLQQNKRTLPVTWHLICFISKTGIYLLTWCHYLHIFTSCMFWKWLEC